MLASDCDNRLYIRKSFAWRTKMTGFADRLDVFLRVVAGGSFPPPAGI